MNNLIGETVVQFHERKRRRKIVQLFEVLVGKHSRGMIYVAWDNASTHEDIEVEVVLQVAACIWFCCICRPVAAFLNPIEMVWRHLQCEVTHYELFETIQALLAASVIFSIATNLYPQKLLSVISLHSAVAV